MIKVDTMNFSVDNIDRWVEKMYKGEPFVRWGISKHCSAAIHQQVDHVHAKPLFTGRHMAPAHISHTCMRQARPATNVHTHLSGRAYVLHRKKHENAYARRQTRGE